MEKLYLSFVVYLVFVLGASAITEPVEQEGEVVDGTVNIGLKDFLHLHQVEERLSALLKNLTTPQQPLPPPPRSYVVKNTTIMGTAVATSHVAKLDLRFQVTVLQSGWCAIPLISNQHTVASHRLYAKNGLASDNQNLQLSTSDGYYTLFVRQQGDYIIDLEIREPILSRSTKPHLLLQFAPDLDSVTNYLELRVPSGSTVSLTPLVFVETSVPESENQEDDTTENQQSQQEVTAKAFFPPTETLKIEWSVNEALEPQEPKPDGKKQVPTSMRAQGQVLYDINDDGFISITATFSYDITLGKQNKFLIKFDEDIKILDVSGYAVDKWEIGYLKTLTGNKDDSGKVLYIYLDQAMDKQFQVKIIAEMASAFDLKKGNTTAEVILPTFAAMDVRRENLILAISASPFLEVTELKRDSAAVKVDPRELLNLGWIHPMGSPGHPILFSYTTSTSAVKILLDLTKHKDVPVLPAIIESAILQSTFVTDRILYHFYLTVRNSQKQYLRVEIPDREYEVWSTFVGSDPVKPSSDEAGALLVPIKKDIRSSGRENVFVVEIVYYAPAVKLDQKGEMQFQIPKVDIPITRFYLQLNLPSTYIFDRFEGSDLQKLDKYSCPAPPSQPQPQAQPQTFGYGIPTGTNAAFMPSAKKQGPRIMEQARAMDSRERRESDFAQEAVYTSGLGVPDAYEGGGGGSFDQSSSAFGGLDSGVLPVQIPKLLVGDQYCFERMLVHEKGFLTLNANYLNKEYPTVMAEKVVRSVGLPGAAVLVALCLFGMLLCRWRKTTAGARKEN